MMEDNAPKLDPVRSALLLMDYQPAVLGSIEEGFRASLVQNASTALDWARGVGMTVAHVRVAFSESDLAAISPRNKAFAPLRGGNMLLDGAPECEVIDDLKPTVDEPVIRKIRFGSFSTTKLGSLLKERGVESLVLAGVTTGGVVLSTVRDAADQDYRLYVLADACGDSDPNVHATLMERVLPQQSWIIETSDLPELM
jgi:nicotinamidase-related amidase